MNFDLLVCSRDQVTRFLEKWHYSQDINGVISDYCFGLASNGELVGAAIFGAPAMAGQDEPYTDGGKLKVTELRRLACIDDTPKNTESYFIGKMLRWMAINSDIDVILSYADETHGHVGTIYKASNFVHVGKSPAIRKILWNGKTYHDKALRTKYRGEVKPFAARLAEALKAGEATWIETKPKNIYVYKLRRKHKSKPRIPTQEGLFSALGEVKE